MSHPYDIRCYTVPDHIIKLGTQILLFAYSKKFINQLEQPHITNRKGWYQFRFHRSGNPLCISINEQGTRCRNTVMYYRKNNLYKLTRANEFDVQLVLNRINK